MNDFFKSTILNSHATIIEIPRGYGFDFALKKINFPKEIQVIKIEPTIHGTQKTESINVEDIENLQKKAKVKSVKKRCFIFMNAERMNETAQNKFLKIFEEPTKNTSFLLLTENKNAFEKTILSRAQILRIPPISNVDSLNILKKTKLNDQDKQKILFLAEGLPGEIEKLSNGKKYFNEQMENAEIAKRWFMGSRFDKILAIKTLKSDRDKTLKVLEILLKITNQTFAQNPKENALKTKEILRSLDRISKNGNISLILLKMAIA